MADLPGPGIGRAHANNGGDIALWLVPGESLTCALAVTGGLGRVVTRSTDRVRGIATSGWRGRSLSLGSADAVTVLARPAAMAAAAAAMIATAVDLPGHSAIGRRAAREVQVDSDLGDLAVTVAVGPLSPEERAAALAAGQAAAEGFRARGLIEAAALFLQGEMRATGGLALPKGAGQRD